MARRSLQVRRKSTRRSVLIVDPDPLARWSLAEFLGRWFNVETAEAPPTRGLERNLIGVILSDATPAGVIDAFEASVRRAAPAATIIRTVTNAHGAKRPGNSVRIEKPFKLTDVGRVLGLSLAEMDTVRDDVEPR